MLTISVFLFVSVQQLDNVKSNAVRSASRKWPNGVVPYEIGFNLSSQFRTVFAAAISDIQAKTCAKFVPKTNQQNWMSVKNMSNDMCGSQIGMNEFPGPQVTFYGNGCGANNHDVSHELIHTLGFFHENNRYDRDDYVTIMISNINATFLWAYDKRNSSESINLVPAYDYGSVMHYGGYEFGNNRGKTIESVPKGKVLGNSIGPSATDILKINLLYQCNNKAPGVSCSDSNTNCLSWANYGECSRNPTWMKPNCKKSCSQC